MDKEEILSLESSGDKINKILPNLLESNNKSISNLLNKLRVNLFFQNHENKAKKSFNDLIKLSDERHKYSRNGESLNGIIARSTDDIKKISYHINNDNFFIKNDVLQEEIKILKDKRKTEEEKKIPELISSIRTSLKRRKKFNSKNEIEIYNPTPRSDIGKIKVVLTDKFNEEQNNLNKNFSLYKEKLQLIEKYPELGKKNFGDFHFSFNLNSLYYTKPIKQPKIFNRRDYTNMNKINRIMLNREDEFEKQNNKLKIKNSNNNLIDSLNEYKNIVKIVKNESSNDLIYNQRMNAKKEKIQKLLNKGLPEPSEYEKILYQEKIRRSERNKKKNEERKNLYGTEEYMKEFDNLKKESNILLSDEFFVERFYTKKDRNYEKRIKEYNLKKKNDNMRSLSEENLTNNKKPKYLVPLKKFGKRKYIIKPQQSLNKSDTTQSTNLEQNQKRENINLGNNSYNIKKNILITSNNSNLLFENNEL